MIRLVLQKEHRKLILFYKPVILRGDLCIAKAGTYQTGLLNRQAQLQINSRNKLDLGD
jgi:hypothetical protein